MDEWQADMESVEWISELFLGQFGLVQRKRNEELDDSGTLKHFSKVYKFVKQPCQIS